jgi:hypothetical protein
MKSKEQKSNEIQKKQNWVFTFGFNQKYENGYTVVYGTFESAREEMIEKFGIKWSMQYPDKESAGVYKFDLNRILKAQISSFWRHETGKWNGKKFIKKHKSPVREKLIEVVLILNNQNETLKGKKEIVNFLGGPTGFESYYLKDLLKPKESENFCICGGTINSWPNCYVKTKDLIKIIKDLKCQE